jgi:hypothetical protein
LLPSLYGDIVSDLAAGLVGGLGVAPGANIGERAAVFEAVHGSAPKYAGQNRANPTALILSGALMLRHHLGETDAADAVESAVRSVIAQGQTVTHDLGGTAGTREFGDAVAARGQATSDERRCSTPLVPGGRRARRRCFVGVAFGQVDNLPGLNRTRGSLDAERFPAHGMDLALHQRVRPISAHDAAWIGL